MQESFWHKVGQNPLNRYWDIVIFMVCAIFSNSSHLGIPNCKKIQRIHTRNILAQRRINFNQWFLRYCHFRVYAIFSIHVISPDFSGSSRFGAFPPGLRLGRRNLPTRVFSNFIFLGPYFCPNILSFTAVSTSQIHCLQLKSVWPLSI